MPFMVAVSRVYRDAKNLGMFMHVQSYLETSHIFYKPKLCQTHPKLLETAQLKDLSPETASARIKWAPPRR